MTFKLFTISFALVGSLAWSSETVQKSIHRGRLTLTYILLCRHTLLIISFLLGKHEGLERDLAALGDKIRQLDDTANRLMATHGDSADATYSKQREINEAWQQLQARANARKEKLLDSYDLQR